MKKTLISIALVLGLVCITNVSHAQNGRFSVGAEVGLPIGNFADATSLGVGGTLRYEYPVNDNLALMLTAGYLTFSGKTVGGFDLGSWGMIPAQVGAKYYFTEMMNGLYGAIHLGIHSLSYKTPKFTYIDPFTGTSVTLGGETFTSTDFSYAPEIGYHLANIDIGARYQMISTTGSTTSYLGVRVAYVFGEK